MSKKHLIETARKLGYFTDREDGNLAILLVGQDVVAGIDLHGRLYLRATCPHEHKRMFMDAWEKQPSKSEQVIEFLQDYSGDWVLDRDSCLFYKHYLVASLDAETYGLSHGTSNLSCKDAKLLVHALYKVYHEC